MSRPKTRGAHCPMCGQFARKAMTFSDTTPEQLLQARILSLEAQLRELERRNEALSKVAAVQAHRLVTMSETMLAYSHESPAPRQRREA